MTITNGYCSLLDIKYLLRITTIEGGDDAVIEDMITQASRLIDNLTGRRFYAATATRYYDVPVQDVRFLWLDDDLLTVTTLTNGDGTVLTTADYKKFPVSGAPYYKIGLKESSSYIWESATNGDTEGVISVAGTWGYSATAPADIQQACEEIVLQAYHRRFGKGGEVDSIVTPAGAVITPSKMPASAREIIEKYKRVP